MMEGAYDDVVEVEAGVVVVDQAPGTRGWSYETLSSPLNQNDDARIKVDHFHQPADTLYMDILS